MSTDFSKVRADFPILTKKINSKSLVYLDSAATALKPWPVIERLGAFYSYETANVHRGAHLLADQATQNFEGTREKVRQFINANESVEIVFTKGTTESINLVASTWGRANISPGDNILITELEHHSNIVPWQMLREEKGAILEVVPILDSGDLNMEALEKLLTSKTKILAITHCSNHLGTINPIKEIINLAHKNGVLVLVDGAQLAANRKIDVKDLDADFYAFSGHKIFGPYGVGILYGKKELLEHMPPYQGGGSMISSVTFKETTYNDIPYKFEAGTPNISGVIGLSAAIDYMEKIGFAEIEKHETELTAYAQQQLLQIEGLSILSNPKVRAPLLSFVIEGFHHSDVAQILDQEGIAVRSGHHCTQPLLRRLMITGSVRASFSIYNNRHDVDKLVAGLRKAKELLQ